MAWKIHFAEGERLVEAQDLPGAEASFRQALHDARKDKSSSSDDIVHCMLSLGGVMQMQDEVYEVIPVYKKAVKMLERAHGKESMKVVPALMVFGDLYENEGDYRKAMKYYSRAVSITRKCQGADSLAVAEYEHRLARATFKAGLPRRAEELYFDALSIVMQQPALPSSAFVEQVLSDYIDLFRNSDYPEKILTSQFQKELLKDEIGELETTKGVTASTWNKEVSVRLADVQPAQTGAPGAIPLPAGATAPGAMPAATENDITAPPAIVPDRPMSDFAALEKINKQRVDFYERMIATDIDSLGASHPSVARDLSGLAAIYLTQKKYAEAKPLLERALAIYRQSYGVEALLVKRTQALLGLITQEKEPLSESNAWTEYLVGLPTIPLQAQKLEVAFRLNYLAFLCYCHGRINDAEKVYAWALAATSRSSGEQSLLVAASLTDYSRVLRSVGRTPEAERMERSAHSLLRRASARQAALSLP